MFKTLAQIEISPDDLDIPMTGSPNDGTVSQIMSLVFAIAGAIALIVIIVAGIQFILSRGDPQKAATARAAIIYAAIGLVVATLAFSIVTFVLGEI